MTIPTPFVKDIRSIHRLVELTCLALEKPIFDDCDIIPLTQSFGFLEQYRYDVFEWRDAHIRENHFDRIARKSAQGRASDAFALAGKTVFPTLEREAITYHIEEVMTQFCKGKSVNRTNAIRFFAVVKAELEKTR